MRRVPLVVLLLFSLAGVPSRVHPTATPILSPPLATIGLQRLALTLPSSCIIVSRDPPSHWQASSYDLRLRQDVPMPHSHNVSHGAYLEVLMHDLVWAKMHGDLSGTRFRTSSGLRGILTEAQYRPGERDWYLTIPVHESVGALTVRLGGLTGSRRKQWRMVYALFMSVHFLEARSHTRIGYGSHHGWQSLRLAAEPLTVVPLIARLAGFRVGVDTIEGMEGRLGPGRAYTGEHPHGAREWQDRRTHWQINADGFDHSYSGRVLNTLELGADASPIEGSIFDTPMPTPLIRLRRRSLGWMGVVFPGMTQRQVLRVVKGKLPMPQVKGNVWRWSAKGFIRVNPINHRTYKDWNASVSFEGGRVSDISLECE